MMYAFTPDPPASSFEAVQDRSTCPQLAALAMRAVGTEGGVTSAASRLNGKNSAITRNLKAMGTDKSPFISLDFLEPIMTLNAVKMRADELRRLVLCIKLLR